MDWSNERWVKLYTRDTMTAIRMGWQGRALLHELLRKVDRAGCMDGVIDPVADLAAFTGLPEDVVKVGLERLTRVHDEERATVEVNGHCLVIPNFIEAQESVKSDKQRQKDLRERRRAEFMSRSVTAPSQNVIEPSRAVTPCHDASRRDKTIQEETIQEETIQEETNIVGPAEPTTRGKASPKPKKKAPKHPPGWSVPVWNAYSKAYEQRHGVAPVSGAQNYALCTKLREALGDDAIEVARFYCYTNNSYHAGRKHPLTALLADAGKFHTEWVTGRHSTQTEARQGDRRQALGSAGMELLEEYRREGEDEQNG